MLLSILSIIDIFAPQTFAQIAVTVFLGILFTQSGLDKVIDWKGNLGWLTGHFADSPLKNMVPMLLAVITVFELAAGFVSLAGGALIIFTGGTTVAMYGAELSIASLIMLFFGQRMAKDYAGAGGLVPYFVAAIIALVLLYQ